MFTGLVEELAAMTRMELRQAGASIQFAAKKIMSDMQLGDSIAINGVCLTVIDFSSHLFTVEAVPETLRRTNLGKLKPGQSVHVERALSASGRFGGHIVSGHVDGLGMIRDRQIEGIAKVLTIDTTPYVMRYVVEKGSICIDGVSLTVMDVAGDSFRVSVIPHTGSMTMLGEAKIGQAVNLECDVLAKYVEKLLRLASVDDSESQSRSADSSRLNEEFLRLNGFA